MTNRHGISERLSHVLIILCTFLLVVALIAAFASFFIPKTVVSNTAIPHSYPIDAAGYKTESLSIGTATISVEIADTDALREQGLSDRTSLGANAGMLFVFQSDLIPDFWMKDMNFPLDMIWIDASGTIADITNDILPASYPSTVSPKTPIRYVLEVNAHFAQANGIVVGDSVKSR
jgi:uncharacterized membrane protein (UPF0127 family)